MKGQLSFIWGLVEALKSGKLHFWQWNLFYGASVDVGRIQFFHLVRFRPWDPAKTLDLSKKTPHFFTMRSEDSETAHLLGSGPVLRHNNAYYNPIALRPVNTDDLEGCEFSKKFRAKSSGDMEKLMGCVGH